ncbi:MAG TPA: LysM peptidoglycan-binding domain-containing protein [Cyclobacteriaceae bacterium]|nr:LysM peptidoglycan-binding domain-containing protein [Cyclobacteriaceae bacterium]
MMPHDTLAFNHFLHLDTFAKLTGSCVEDLQALNPRVKRSAIPEDGKLKTINVPRSAKEKLAANRKSILDSAALGKREWEALVKASGDYTYGREQNIYRVRNGDVLGTIAHRFGVSVRNLKEWNNLRSNMIRVGQRLVIWVAPSLRVSHAPSHTSPAQSGDSPKTMAAPAGYQEASRADH